MNKEVDSPSYLPHDQPVQEMSVDQLLSTLYHLQSRTGIVLGELAGRSRVLAFTEEQREQLEQLVIQMAQVLQAPLEGEPITSQWAIARETLLEQVRVLAGGDKLTSALPYDFSVIQERGSDL